MNVHILMPKTSNQKERIIKTALKLFARNGYAATPISQIAATAKVSQGLMYNFFESKEKLLIEIMKMGFRDIHASMVAYEKQTSPQEAITQHIKATIRIVQQHHDIWKLLHTIRLQEKVATTMKKHYRDTVAKTTRVFARAFQALGHAQPEAEALLFLAQIDGLVVLYLQDPQTPIEELGDLLTKRYTK